MQPEYRYTCSTCEKCNLCVVCYKKKGHSHEMQWSLQPSDVDTLQPSLSYHEARRQSIQRCIQALSHACQCRDTSCSQSNCQKMKRVVLHNKSCSRKTKGGCPICKQLIALCCYHAIHCQEQKCPVPFCLNIKHKLHKLRQQQLQQRLQQAQVLRRRMAALQNRQTPPSTIAPTSMQENINGTHVQVNMPQCTFTSTLYPTGEDALAWNDSLQDFFKTDEDTTRSIQQSWPSNLLVKHLIRDRFFHSYLCEYWKQYQSFPGTLATFVKFVVEMSAKQFYSDNGVGNDQFKTLYENLCILVGKAAFENHTNHNSVYVYKSQLEESDSQQSGFGWLKPVDSSEAEDAFQFVHDSIRQYLMAVWVAHTVRTQTDCTELLRVCADEKSAHLPITCYSLAHLLGMADFTPTYLSQFLTLLMHQGRDQNDFNHLLLVVKTTAESNQLGTLSYFVENLFPDKTLDLSDLPEISHHGLHCLAQLIRSTTFIQTIRLPENRSIRDVLEQYPFRQKPVSNVGHANQVKLLSYLPLFECLPDTSTSTDKGSFIKECKFSQNDKDVDVESIHRYLQHAPSLQNMTVRLGTFFEGALGNLSKSLLFTPNITTVVIAVRATSSEEVAEAMKILSCLHRLENVEFTECWCSDKCVLSVVYATFTLQCKARCNIWPGILSFRPFDMQRLTVRGRYATEWMRRTNLIPEINAENLVSHFQSLQSLAELKFGFLPNTSTSTWSILFQGLASLPAENTEAGKFPPLELLWCTNCGLTSQDIKPLAGQLKTFQNMREIDLSHNAISDEAATGLAEGLSSCQNLKKVNLSDNKLSDRGDFLPPLPNLEEIDLSHNAISDEAVPGLAVGFGSCQNLNHVHLRNNKISNKGAWLLLLQDRCKRIQMETAGNNISDDLVSLLSNRQNGLQDFEEIDLSHTDLSDEIALALKQMLGPYQNLRQVNLSHNKLSDRGDFLPPLPNLEEIDLSHNAINDEAVPGLAKGLGSCQNLKKVNLSYNKLSDRRDFLPPLPNLEEIDLSNSAISDEAVSGLAEGLASCHKLKTVNLSHNKFSRVRDLMEAFIKLPIMIHVNLEYNSISDDSLPVIAAWLKAKTDVKEVGLRGNRFSAEGVRDFVRTMKGKAYRWFSDDLLYDGSQAEVGEAVESGGEGARTEEQQWEELRKETEWMINVKFRQQTVRINHRGTRSNNPQSMSP
ncbi:uncharacterized protein LOC144865760 [Branchiostoma floridae x Branchiostoma japonicum]